MLQITGLSVWMNRNQKEILHDFTFSLNPGDRAAVIGEVGNGKSTLLRIAAGDPTVEAYASWSGTAAAGKDRIGYLRQELSEAEKAMTVGEFFASRSVTADALYELKSQGMAFGLFDEDQPVGTLSGGEKVRLQLSAVMAQQPDLLLLDEPTNDLDIETLEWLEKFMLRCRLPMLYVSHDELLLERTANVIIHLEQVRKKTVCRHTIVRMGYQKYVSQRLNLLDRQEQLARKEKEEYEKKQKKLQQIFEKVEFQQETITRACPGGGRLLKKKMHAVKSMERRFDREAETMTQLPDAEDAISFDFGGNAIPDGKAVLRLRLDALSAGGKKLSSALTLDVTGGEHIGIIGPNGAGKTTLLRRVAEELLARDDLRVSYMPQNYAEAFDEAQTVLNFLVPSGRKEELTRARTCLGSMKYTHEEAEGTIAALSGGQKAKLLFVRMILNDSNVLLLDEPTRNFSPLSNPVIRRSLQAYPGAVISVSHDRMFLQEVCRKVYRLTENGLRRER